MSLNPVAFRVALAVVAFAVEEVLRTGLVPAAYAPLVAAVSVVLSGLVRPPARKDP